MTFSPESNLSLGTVNRSRMSSLQAKKPTFSLELSQELIERAPIGLAYLNAEDNLIHANHQLMAMMDVPNATGSVEAWMRLIELPGVRLSDEKTSILDLLIAGKPISHEDVEYITITGTRRWMNVYGAPRLDEDKKLIEAFLICVDTTEQKELQSRLRNAQKMEALGQLASGVAHDFNNLLTVILGKTELIQMLEEHPGITRQYIDDIRDAAEKAADLVVQLLDFSRNQPTDIDLINLNEVITKLRRMMLHLIGEGVELNLNLDPNIPPIKGNNSQLEQILINLIVNARDAMNGSGIIEIRSSVSRLDEELGFGSLSQPQHVRLTVTDTGCGMSDEIISKAFEPFFTTKRPGKGTGLGLSTVYGIVKTHGGQIDIQSEPGKGTSFHLYFPIVASRTELPESTARPVSPVAGSETIILVEDDESVNNLTTEMLKSLGYTVLPAFSGSQAINTIKNTNSRIDLLFTDLMLPDISGTDLIKQFKVHAPEIKVLLSSGYTPEEFTSSEDGEAEFMFLQKPFRIGSLAVKIREALDQ